MCALCGNALDPDALDSIVPDHRIAETDGGRTELANLYLAHRTCNSSRQHLDFNVAQPLAKFQSLAAQKGAIDFDQVLDTFLAYSRQPISYKEIGGDRAEVGFGSQKLQVPLWADPATGVKYFFAEVPTSYIFNDTQIQPRKIMPAHVRKLAVDFLERPVHEPSNCRLVANLKSAKLLQFDGQHKTTAQILLGREHLQMKVYVEPSIDMLQALVIKIQQEIKKQPLTKSDTLAKISDVMQRYLDGYVAQAGKIRTEKGLIESQKGTKEKKVVKGLYFDDLLGIIFFDQDNKLSAAVRPGTKDAPTSDKIVIQKIIAPLVYKQPLEVDMDSSNARDIERSNILFILNSIAEFMLPPTWNKPGSETQKRRADAFFQQGSIGWWMNEILIPSLRYILTKIGDKKPLLIEEMDETQRSHVVTVIETLCSWPIWSTEEPSHLRAMRSNTIQNVADEFPDYNDKKLLSTLK
nr:HNH endonuclease signature motif containing protein [Luteimonas sp. MC1750]